MSGWRECGAGDLPDRRRSRSRTRRSVRSRRRPAPRGPGRARTVLRSSRRCPRPSPARSRVRMAGPVNPRSCTIGSTTAADPEAMSAAYTAGCPALPICETSSPAPTASTATTRGAERATTERRSDPFVVQRHVHPDAEHQHREADVAEKHERHVARVDQPKPRAPDDHAGEDLADDRRDGVTAGDRQKRAA